MSTPLLVRQTAFNFSFVHSVSFYIDLGNWWAAWWSNRMCRALEATDWYMNSFIGFYLVCLFVCVFFLFQSEHSLILPVKVFKYEQINCQSFTVLNIWNTQGCILSTTQINNIYVYIRILSLICIIMLLHAQRKWDKFSLWVNTYNFMV